MTSLSSRHLAGGERGVSPLAGGERRVVRRVRHEVRDQLMVAVFSAGSSTVLALTLMLLLRLGG